MRALNSICVFCGSSEGDDERIVEAAVTLGKKMAQQQISLVYGGAKIGIMGKVADSVMQCSGEVVGVIPEFLKQKEIVHLGVHKLITTTNMHERKMKMQALSDGFITLPGGFGSLEELFEVITWSQLGLHQKPIGLLNVEGFYDDLLAMLEHMVHKEFLKKEDYKLLLVDKDIDKLLEKMKAFKSLKVSKWLKKDRT
ncbi:TIGR00730 family Rossman fold protein [Aquimarina aquimarini]|uniref:LOG family protein n=1 Tax=Aquimarina aquimarini TaxID=1191734 RepID=UPI000D5540B3|nr:TIGR00730 family Rossman fold protein [Aquimarina aquimarini]